MLIGLVHAAGCHRRVTVVRGARMTQKLAMAGHSGGCSGVGPDQVGGRAGIAHDPCVLVMPNA